MVAICNFETSKGDQTAKIAPEGLASLSVIICAQLRTPSEIPRIITALSY